MVPQSTASDGSSPISPDLLRRRIGRRDTYRELESAIVRNHVIEQTMLAARHYPAKLQGPKRDFPKIKKTRLKTN